MDNNIKLLGYRIDNRLYYSVENKTLFSLDGSEKSIPLRTTKARLLEYLLFKSGDEVITDHELLKNIWDKYGLSSSSQRLWLVMRELKVILCGFNWPAPTIRYNTQLVTSESSFSEWPFLQPAANSDGVW